VAENMIIVGLLINKKIDESYEFQSVARIVVGGVVGVGVVIETLAGLGLSFTALSPFYRWSSWCCISSFASARSYRVAPLLSQ
jgi:hypothetical protein